MRTGGKSERSDVMANDDAPSEDLWWTEDDESSAPESDYGPLHPSRVGPDPGEGKNTTKHIKDGTVKRFTATAFLMAIGLFSPWGWYVSGFQALRWSFQDVLYILTDGLSFYSAWGMNPLEYTHWLMGPLLPLVFVTTFVVTWYKFRNGDEEFGRKASIFHLSFFGVWWSLGCFFWGVFLPSEWDYGTFIAAASGIGLHPTAYGLEEKFSNTTSE
jgi:hypothetical protein